MQGKTKRVKKIPLRRCIACGEMKQKQELVRVVKNKEEEIFLDLTGKAAGRGAYLCKTLDCLQKARKSRAVERAFHCKIEAEVYDSMEHTMKQQPEEQADE